MRNPKAKPERRPARPAKPSRSGKSARSRKSYSIAAVRASLDVLDRFTEQERWGLSELTQDVGQSKTRVFRILSTFEECGYLLRDETSGSYRLGPRLAALSNGSV